MNTRRNFIKTSAVGIAGVTISSMPMQANQKAIDYEKIGKALFYFSHMGLKCQPISNNLVVIYAYAYETDKLTNICNEFNKDNGYDIDFAIIPIYFIVKLNKEHKQLIISNTAANYYQMSELELIVNAFKPHVEAWGWSLICIYPSTEGDEHCNAFEKLEEHRNHMKEFLGEK